MDILAIPPPSNALHAIGFVELAGDSIPKTMIYVVSIIFIQMKNKNVSLKINVNQAPMLTIKQRFAKNVKNHLPPAKYYQILKI